MCLQWNLFYFVRKRNILYTELNGNLESRKTFNVSRNSVFELFQQHALYRIIANITTNVCYSFH